jgi:predicted PurR-regulated permease PerM
MLGWLIVLGVSMILGVSCWLIPEEKTSDAFGTILGIVFVVCCFAFVVSGSLLIFEPIATDQDISVFKQQKQYIENHQVADPVENAAITTKKIEQNQWLFTAKWAEDKWGIFSFYPNNIQDLEPIQ